jgi:hypothetical protein
MGHKRASNVGGSDNAKRRQKNRQSIYVYVVVIREAIYPGKSTGYGEGRGTADGLPISSFGISLLEDPDNFWTHRHVRPLLAVLHEIDPGLFSFIERSPLEVSRWQQGFTDADVYDYRDFNRAIDYLERQLEKTFPGVRLGTNTKPKYLPAVSHLNARDLDRKAGTYNDRKKLYDDWMKNLGTGVDPVKAKKIVASKHQKSIRTVERAIAEFR